MSLIERIRKRRRAKRLRMEAAELFTYNCGIAWGNGFGDYMRVEQLEAEAKAIEDELALEREGK